MATKSIGATARDYATLALWAAYVNALALSAPEIGECYNDSEFTFVATVTLGGWTGDSGTNTVTLKCAAGQSFRDNASVQSNALRYNQANGVGARGTVGYGAAINVTGGNCIIDGLQVYNDSASGQGAIGNNQASGAVQNCILYSKLRTAGNSVLLVNGNPAVAATNCLVLVNGTTGRGVSTGQAGALTDLTIVAASGAGTGAVSPYSGNVWKNCAVYGFTTDYSGTASASSTNNATDLGAFGGTNYGTSGQVSLVGTTEWQSVTAGSEDLRLKSTSAKLKDNGATAGPTNDIAGTTRPQGSAYDIGAWELVVAASVTVGEMVAAAQHGYNMPRGKTGVIGYDI